MKTLVLGAGMLAYYLKPYQPNFASKTKKNWKNFHLCDIRFPEQLEKVINKIEPEIVINTVAMGNIKRCELNPKLAEEINHIAHQNAISICNKRNIKLIYISTSSVFSGNKGNYNEEDTPHPTTIYGLTKLRGELATQKSSNDLTIFRVTAIFGDYPSKMDFIQKTINELKLSNNFQCWEQVISPSWGVFVAEMIIKLIEKNVTGIWHIAGEEQLSRFEIGNIIYKNIQNGKITKVPTPKGLPMNRSLCVEKLKREFPGMEFPSFEEIIRKMVK